MALFSRRPLMFCCFCFMAMAVFGFCINSTVKMLVLILLFLAAVSFLVLSIALKKNKNIRVTMAVLFVAMLFASVSLAESYVYYDIYEAKLNSHIGKPCNVECTVLTKNKAMSYMSEYTVKLRTVDGEEANGQAVVQFPYDMGFDEGEAVSFDAECVSLSEVTLGNSDRMSLLSNGVSVAFVSKSELEDIIFYGDTTLVTEAFREIQSSLSYKLQNAVGDDAGALSAAVAIGDRSGLSDEIKRDFSRSGISHLLSLSGMHMAIIATFFCFLLKLCYVPRKVRSFIMPLIMVIYLCISGFSLPTLRATIMLSAVYLSFVFGARTDARTVLFFSGAFIIAVMPYAVADVGFWMSFLATLGLIVLYPASVESGREEKNLTAVQKLKIPKYLLLRFAKKILLSVLVTVIATLSVIFLTQMFFGELSLISPVSNLVSGPCVMLITVLSMIYLVIGGIPYISSLVIYVIRSLCNAVIWVCTKCSDIENICVSLEPIYAKIIVWCFCLLIAVLLIVKLKNKRIIFMIAPLVAAISFGIGFCVNYALCSDRADAVYIRRGESETLTVVTAGKSVMIDMADGNYTNYIFAWNDAHIKGATELDTLVLTHYHDKHEYSVNRLMSEIKVRRIMVPEPTDKEELWVAKDLEAIAKKHGAEFAVYNPKETVGVLENLGFIQYERGQLKRSTQDTLAFEVIFGEESLAYVGSSYFESMGYGINENIKDADCVIYGTHGPNPKKSFLADSIKTAEETVIADEELLAFAEIDFGDQKDVKITVNCEKYETVLRRKNKP